MARRVKPHGPVRRRSISRREGERLWDWCVGVAVGALFFVRPLAAGILLKRWWDDELKRGDGQIPSPRHL